MDWYVQRSKNIIISSHPFPLEFYPAHSAFRSLDNKAHQAEELVVGLVVDHVLHLIRGEASAEVEVVKDLDGNSGGVSVHDNSDLDGAVNGAVDVVRVTNAVSEVESRLGTSLAGAEDFDNIQLTAATIQRARVVTLPAAARGVLRGSGNGGIEQPVGRHVLVGASFTALRHGELDDEDLGCTLESLCNLVSNQT